MCYKSAQRCTTMYNSALLVNWMLVEPFVSNKTLPGCLFQNLGRQVNIDSTNGVLPGSKKNIHCPLFFCYSICCCEHLVNITASHFEAAGLVARIQASWSGPTVISNLRIVLEFLVNSKSKLTNNTWHDSCDQ